jgi:hypothetical protein
MQPFRSGRLCHRTAVVALVIIPVLMLAVCSASAENGSKGGKRAKASKRKEGVPSASVTPGEGEQSLTNIPLPIGHEAKGLVLPDFDLEGRLRGKFIAGSARRIDQDHIGFRDLKITTYTDANQIDMQIDMHTSTFDLTTRILSSQERTTVSRHDFNIVADSATFDTNARTSRMIGNVKMVITDQSQFAEKKNP